MRIAVLDYTNQSLNIIAVDNDFIEINYHGDVELFLACWCDYSINNIEWMGDVKWYGGPELTIDDFEGDPDVKQSIKSRKRIDYYQQIKDVKRGLIEEIKSAVKEHGGKYTWNPEGDCYPEVPCVAAMGKEEPIDVCIKSIAIDDDNRLSIEAFDKDGDELRAFTINDVFVEHLEFILDYMQ